MLTAKKRAFGSVKKVLLFFFYIKGFFLGYLSLRIIILGQLLGTKKTVPNNRHFCRLLAVFSAVCAVVKPDVSRRLWGYIFAIGTGQGSTTQVFSNHRRVLLVWDF